MFAGQTATYYVDGKRETREETPQHPGNGEFFPGVIQPHGLYNRPIIFNLGIQSCQTNTPIFIKSVLYCFLSHPEMKFLDNVTYLYMILKKINIMSLLSYKGEIRRK